MEATGDSGSLLGVKGSQVAGDVLADSLDLGEFGSAAGGGLGVAEGAEFLFEFLDIGAESCGVLLSNFLVDLLFHHRNKSNIKIELIFNLLIYPQPWAECRS